MAFPWILPAAAIGAIGAGISGGQQRADTKEAIEAQYKPRPERKAWVEQYAGKYPGLQPLQLPGIAPEAASLISNLMSGQLPQGVSQALGGGAERAYGSALSGLSDIGAGPATLAGMRGDIMGRLGEQKAMMGWQGMQAGLGAVPAMSELMMQPQKWSYATQQRKWQDIADLFLQTPGAAYATPGEVAPTPTPIPTTKPSMPKNLYGPGAEAWRREHGYYY